MHPSTLWRATRAYSLPASVVPVLLGTVLAARGFTSSGPGRFDPSTFFLVLAGAVLAHFGANVLNDYFDFIKGVDTRPEHGSGVLTGGDLTARQALLFSCGLFAAAGVCVWLILRRPSAIVLPLTLVGLGCAVLYSAVLKKYGMGDLLIIIAFGLGLTIGAYGVQMGTISIHQLGAVALYSLPVCLLVDAILHANNLRDAADDRAAHVRTLATFLSPTTGRRWQQVLLFGPLLFVLIGTGSGFLPVWTLATFASFPFLWRASHSGSVPGTAQAHLVFGLLYTLSFMLKPIFV